jgi:16S rRNA (adenine1518-N6/adenine1519-N6)-dimethyltransferase
MEGTDYKTIAKNVGPLKRLGQNFLINSRIAKTEANFGIDRNVVELGPGLGILTKELCKIAKHVTAVEKDKRLCEVLSEIRSRKLELINDDFFNVNSKLTADIMISNIPYNLSSKVLSWLGSVQMPAVLCLQREFVEHMTAKPGSRSYSRLSVFSYLQFKMSYIMDVPANDFYPMPRVGSALVYLKPKQTGITKGSYEVLALLMMHKKKTLKNALMDSAKLLGIEKDQLSSIAQTMPNRDKRPLHLSPEDLLSASDYISKELKKIRSISQN